MILLVAEGASDAMVYAALVTGLTGIVLGIITKWPIRKRPPRLNEVIDARAQWLVDQLQEQLNTATKAAEDCRTERDGLRAELAEVRAELYALEAKVDAIEKRRRPRPAP